MKVKLKLLLPAILLCIASFCYAEVSDESLNKILDLSGLTQQVAQFPGMLKAGMEQAKQQGTLIPDADHQAMLMSVDQSVVPAEILAEIRTALKKTLSEEETKQLLVWYESDLGKEITRAEEKASTPEAQQEMMQLADSFMGDLERLEYAMRLDMATGMTGMAMDFNQQTSIAVYSAIMADLQPDKPLNLEPLKAKMKAERAETREAIQGMVFLSLVYTYKDLEIAKLKKYEKFLKDPVAKKFIKIVSKSINQALKSSVSKVVNAIILMVKNKKQEK